ncbi:MAG: dihydropyrimidinase [Clostridia bacterium]|nr:dihydropyrimidinase [Clostridia bacterium]
MRILIQNGTVVTDGKQFAADVLTENDKILKVAPAIAEAADKVIDATGMYVLPGFIDTHTHFDLDLGTTITADNFPTGTRAAVKGGTTTVLDFATQDKGMTMQDAYDLWQKKAEGSSCNYGFHMAVSEWNAERIAEIDNMIRQGVTSFKMYMVYDAMKVNDGEIYDALKRTAAKDCLIGVHCENYDILQQRIRELKAEGRFAPEAHPVSRPNEVEAEAVARLMRTAELAGAPAWVVHLSTKEGLEEAERARARGQEVYLETCPQYIALNDSRYTEPDAAKFVMSPPLRKDADREAVMGGLADGKIDFIGTDHCSFTMEQKAMGKDDFTKIPNGGAGAENRGELVYTYMVKSGKATIEQMADMLSTNAAKIFGMYPQKGTVSAGSDADLVVFDPNAERTISWKTNLHNCDNSPYEGLTSAGRARDVLVNGVPAVENFELVKEGAGRFVFRGPSMRTRK